MPDLIAPKTRRSQDDRVYTALMVYGGLCGMQPLRWSPPITRVAARVWSLKKKGVVIDTLTNCPDHGGARHAYYRIPKGESTP